MKPFIRPLLLACVVSFASYCGLMAQGDSLTSAPSGKGNDCCMEAFRSGKDAALMITREIITPNGDGNSDYLCLCGFAAPPYHVQIYDRWGKSVFEDQNYLNNWPAKDHDPKKLPDAAYAYTITFQEGGKEYKLSGFLNIIR